MDTNGIGEYEETAPICIPDEGTQVDEEFIICPHCKSRGEANEIWVTRAPKWQPLQIRCQECHKLYELEIQQVLTFVTRFRTKDRPLMRVG